MNREELQQLLNTTTTTLAILEEQLEKISNETRGLLDWEKEFLSDATVGTWKAQRIVDNITTELGKLP
jgi:uncharacterized protein YoxC